MEFRFGFIFLVAERGGFPRAGAWPEMVVGSHSQMGECSMVAAPLFFYPGLKRRGYTLASAAAAACEGLAVSGIGCVALSVLTFFRGMGPRTPFVPRAVRAGRTPPIDVPLLLPLAMGRWLCRTGATKTVERK